jgi:uncharacterized protein with GYD domain
MATYITLVKLTDQGLRNAKEWPSRIQEAMQVAAEFGCKFDCYMTTGEYDFVGIGEAPDDAAIAKANLSIAARGDVRTVTMRAFGVEEMGRIISSLR